MSTPLTRIKSSRYSNVGKFFKLSSFLVICAVSTALYSQEKDFVLGAKWTVKLGVSVVSDRIVDEPLSSGRGLGCSFSQRLNTKTDLGAKFGLFYHLPINKRGLSVIIGPEILYNSAQRDYFTSFSCIRGLVSEGEGILELQTLKANLTALIRWESIENTYYIESGGYFDLGLSNNSVFEGTQTTYLNNMFQPYPEPLVQNVSTTLDGASYGCIFGVGKNEIFKIRKLDLRLQYYLNLSPTVRLSDDKHLSQSMLDVSFNFRLW